MRPALHTYANGIADHLAGQAAETEHLIRENRQPHAVSLLQTQLYNSTYV